MDDIQWRQAQLPVGLGGLGLGAASDHAPAAYTTSLLSSQDLKLRILSSTEEESPANVHAALLTYLGAKMGEEASLDSLIGVSQKAVSLKINLMDLQLLSKYISGLDEVRETARLASLGQPHSGDWLNVMPSPTLGLRMKPDEFVKYRLGVPVFSSAGQCPACSRHSDALGDHAISCGRRMS